jgi:hypothetical protein
VELEIQGSPSPGLVKTGQNIKKTMFESHQVLSGEVGEDQL